MAIAFVGITLGLLLVGVVVERFSETAALPIWALAYFTGGWFSLRTTLRSLRQRKLDVDLLMLIAAAGAAAVGAYWEGTVLLFLFSLGNVLEEFALGRTEASIRALMDLRPEVVVVRAEDGSEREVAIEAAVGAIFCEGGGGARQGRDDDGRGESASHDAEAVRFLVRAVVG